MGGRFLLRIEDIDTARARPAFVAAIYEDLAWLGITWETPVLVQSEHFPVYAAAAARLAALGVLYPCFASRAEIAAASDPARLDPDGVPLYPGLGKAMPGAERAARLAAGAPHTLRIDMERAIALVQQKGAWPLTFIERAADGREETVAADPARWGDAILVRRETPTSYHLSVVVDDARQGVTHVTRGRDLHAATDLHRLLQILLDLPAPVYHHHPLIMDADGRKLSKSAGDTALRTLRAAGVPAAEVIRRALAGCG